MPTDTKKAATTKQPRTLTASAAPPRIKPETLAWLREYNARLWSERLD